MRVSVQEEEEKQYFDSGTYKRKNITNKYYLPSRLPFSFHASVVKALQLCLSPVPRSKPMILSELFRMSTVLKSFTDLTALKNEVKVSVNTRKNRRKRIRLRNGSPVHVPGQVTQILLTVSLSAKWR